MNKPNTLLKLLSEYETIVPRIQRDYVQGSKEEHSSIVRMNLLKDMKQAFEGETPPLDLNFVYGRTTGDRKFYPVDGQQRLTTLFLLHIYAFAKDPVKTDLLHKFTYEARTTTRDFFKALVDHRDKVFLSDKLPEKEIMDASWFIDSWKYDPSVRNALITLNDISCMEYQIGQLQHCLEEQDNPKVYFQFVQLDDLGESDDLYLKLNARGRELTKFETFKTRLIDRCNVICPALSNEMKQNLDGKWADFMWGIDKEHPDQYDILYLRFFETILLNYRVLKTEANQPVSRNWVYSLEYDLITPEIIAAVRNTLNYICYNDSSVACQTILRVLNNLPSYPGRVLFHAICVYLLDESVPAMVKETEFTDWMRVINNLVTHSKIDEAELYRKAIDSVTSIRCNKKTLLNDLANNQIGALSGFSVEQFEEECQKAEIICKGTAYRQAILQAEQALPYFAGQIRSALFYSDFKNTNDINAFDTYVKKIQLLFDSEKPVCGSKLRQALCSLGDYRLPVSGYYTLCIDDPSVYQKTPSMKTLFSNHGDIVKKLLDQLNVTKPIEPQLDQIIANGKIPQNDWRYCIVNYPQLMRYMSSSHLRMCTTAKEELLVPNKQTNGLNYSVYLQTLALLLEEQNLVSNYYHENGAYGDRYLLVKGAAVRYDRGHYTIDYSDGTRWQTTGRNVLDEVMKKL